MKRPGNADRAVAAQAAKQHSVITHEQAEKAGLTAEQIQGRRRTGRWDGTAARQVYVMAGARKSWQQTAMVAVLAGPPTTVASHLTAAALLDVVKPPEIPHVTVPPNASGRYRGAVVHWSPLDPVDVCVVARIPCTTPARTLVDCASLISYPELCELVDQTLFRHVDARRVRDAMRRAGRAPGRRGFRSLEEALAVWTQGPRPGSPAEMRLVRHLHRRGFPLPERQWKVRDVDGRLVAKIDLAWPRWMAGLEYDGGEFHGPRPWSADDERQDRLEALGWRIGRVTKQDLEPGSGVVEKWLQAHVPRDQVA